MKRHHISFKHAWDGIWYNLTTQPNFRVHLVAALLVAAAGSYLHLAAWEWLILGFTIFWVIVTEMINTALESIVDLVTQEQRQAAKIAKDTSAGVVLVSAFGAVVIALIIFLPHLWLYF